MAPPYVGRQEFVKWAAQSETPTYAACGIVSGGSDDMERAWELVRGIGAVQALESGQLNIARSISFAAAKDSYALMAKAIRAAGVLPEVMMQHGILDADGGVLDENALISTMGCNAGIGGRLNVDLAWLALTTDAVSGTPTAVALTVADTMTFVRGGFTIEAGAYYVQNWDYRLDNRMAYWDYGDERAVDTEAFPPGIEYHDDEHTLTARIRKVHGYDLTADVPLQNITVIAICRDNQATRNVIKFTWDNLAIRKVGRKMAGPGGIVEWDVDFACPSGCLTLANAE